jgi:hypothetical protein
MMLDLPFVFTLRGVLFARPVSRKGADYAKGAKKGKDFTFAFLRDFA